MYVKEDILIYNISEDNTVKEIVGNEFTTEEVKDEQGNVINTITKKFNIETGEYEVI